MEDNEPPAAERSEPPSTEVLDDYQPDDDQDAGLWSIAAPTDNTPPRPPFTIDRTATNPFANRTAGEILGFMPTAEAAAMNLAAETAIHSAERAPRAHTQCFEEANRPLADGENLFNPQLSSKRRHNVIGGWEPRDGSDTAPRCHELAAGAGEGAAQEDV